MRKLRALLPLAIGAAFPALPAPSLAHEIPANVTVVAFVRPDGDRLRILVRVPLEAMRDVEFPRRGPGYLQLSGIEPLLRNAARLWIGDYLETYEADGRIDGERIVAVRVSLPSDRSFASWEGAVAHLQGPPLPANTELIWQQALLDVLFEYPIVSPHSDFSIRPSLAHLGIRTTTVLRFLPASGGERVFQFSGDPGLVRLDPRWHQAVFRFVGLGFRHILDGLDHLLFVLCLVIPFRQVRPLILVVTSFTVAHSITLIALSILWMALENIVAGARPADPKAPGRGPPVLRRRWLFAFAFGLVHGFGFSFFLRESLQFAGAHLAGSLLAFNVGVELGQLFVIALAVPVLGFLFRRVVSEQMGTILLSALVAHTAWHWTAERASALRAYRIEWPAFDLVLLSSLMRGLLLLLILTAAIWTLSKLQLEGGRMERDVYFKDKG